MKRFILFSKLVKHVGAIVILLTSLQAFTAAEMRGYVIRSFDLYKGPAESFGVSEFKVRAGEELWVQGTSVGGIWLRVVKREGGSGWIPASEVKLERVSASDVYEVQQRLEAEGRYQTWFNLEGSLSSGSLPFGKGALMSATFNLAPSGVLGVNRDQFEVGGLVAYYLGREVFGYIDSDGDRFKLNNSSNRKFVTYGLFGQWLFRSGERGSLMIGPRGGFLMTKFNHYKVYHAPLTAGLVLRYFSEEHWGWNASAQVSFETGVYFFYSFGVSYRL